MTKPRSLRLELALGLGAGVMALWLLAMAGAWVVLQGEVQEIYDAALARTADRMAPLALERRDAFAPESTARDEAFSYMVRGADGTVLAQSPGADPAVFGDTPKTGFREHMDHRVFGMTAAGGAVLEVADPLAERREAMGETLLALLIPAAALLPLCLLGAGWFTHARLRPVARLADQVSHRDSGDLRPLSAPGLQVELLPIRDAVDRLMARLADALDAERAFSANAAHELRTPIAATLAQTQRLIAEAPEGPLRNRARTVEAELKRLARLSEKLLDLSRAEAAGVAAGPEQDMRAVLGIIAAEFRGAPDLRLTLPDRPVPIAMDPDAFGILARNLIENALLHGERPIEVALTQDRTLRVVNGGAALPAESLARLTRRFERLGSRRNGSGLGLSIVETLVRNAGARLELRSPAPGRADGLCAIVSWPEGGKSLPVRQSNVSA